LGEPGQVSAPPTSPPAYAAVPGYLAALVFAGAAVVNLVAVADVLTGLGAEVPDRLLHMPWEGDGKRRIELPGIDLG
jgi:hypothetical protein